MKVIVLSEPSLLQLARPFIIFFSSFRTYKLRAGVCGSGMCSGGHFRNHMLRAGTRQMGNSENQVPCLCSMVLVFKVMQNELKSWTAHFEEAPHRRDLSCIFGLSKRIIIILHCIGGGRLNVTTTHSSLLMRKYAKYETQFCCCRFQDNLTDLTRKARYLHNPDSHMVKKISSSEFECKYETDIDKAVALE